MISVAMTSRNGARFLGPQLDSLVGQLDPPDELVIGDDGSTDSTVSALHEFAARAPFPVHVEKTRRSRGVVANMADVLACVEGDLIALADQDDVWRGDKLRRLRQAAESTGAALVFSDAEVIDEHGRTTGDRLWPSLDFSPRQRRRLTEDPPGPLLRHSCASGCTMVVTRAVRDLALPFPDELEDPVAPMLHDRWLALVAACTGPVVALPAPLVGYRRHEGQTTGARRDRRLRQLRDQAVTGVGPVRAVAGARLAQIGAVLQRLSARGVDIGPSVGAQLGDALAHQAMRAELAPSRGVRLRAVIDEMRRGGYRRWSHGSTTAMVDLIRPGDR